MEGGIAGVRSQLDISCGAQVRGSDDSGCGLSRQAERWGQRQEDSEAALHLANEETIEKVASLG